MKKITRHPHTIYQERLNKLLGKRSFEEFLNLFEYVSDKNLDPSPLADQWNNIAKDIRLTSKRSTNYIDTFVAFLAKIEITIPSEPRHPKYNRSNYSVSESQKSEEKELKEKKKTEERHKLAENVFSAILAEVNRDKELKSLANPDYSFFSPAWTLEEPLETYWGINNPARIIGSYMKAIYPKDYSHFSDSKLYFSKPSIDITDINQFFLLYSISLLVEKKTPDLEKHTLYFILLLLWKKHDTRSLEEIHSDIKSKEEKYLDQEIFPLDMTSYFNDDVGKLISIMINSPQSLFNYLLKSLESNYQYGMDIKEEDLLALMGLPIGEVSNNVDSNYRVPKKYKKYYTKNKSLPYIPWYLLKILFAENMVNVIHECVDFREEYTDIFVFNMNRIIHSYKKYRISNYYISPMTSKDTADVMYIIFRDLHWYYGFDLEILDIALLMSEMDFADNGTFFFGWEASTIEERPYYYILAYKLSLNEGLNELGCAFLSFYLFTQLLIVEEGIIDYPNLKELTTTIEDCLLHDRKSMLIKSLQFSAEIAKEKGFVLAALWLRSFISGEEQSIQYKPLKLVKKDDAREYLTRNKIRKELEEELPLEMVTPSMKDMLINTELHWHMSHPHMGRGQEDWGIIAGSYIKPIEYELTTFLKDVITSSAYKSYIEKSGKKFNNKITLGPLLYLLRDYEKLPLELKEGISRLGITLQYDKKLLGELFGIMEVRNKGFHGEILSSDEFINLRKTLFDGKLLERFILALYGSKQME